MLEASCSSNTLRKAAYPGARRDMGVRRKTPFRVFFFVERGVSFLGREDLGSELSEFSRR